MRKNKTLSIVERARQDMQQRIVTLLLQDNYTYAELVEIMGVSRSYIYQVARANGIKRKVGPRRRSKTEDGI